MQAGQAAAHALSGSLIQRAQDAMAAQEAEAAAARASIAQQQPVDPHPFESIPAGTTVREMPDGARMFGLADGETVRAAPDGRLVAFALDGSPHEVAPARDRQVLLPSGRTLRLKRSAVVATHEAVGVSGLPLDVDPVAVGPNRYRFDLEGDLRVEVDRAERRVLLINPTGSVVLLGARLEGIGEKVDVRFVAGGARGFTATDTGHAGVIEADGTIHVALAGGRDLLVRFPEPVEGSDTGRPPRVFKCGART